MMVLSIPTHAFSSERSKRQKVLCGALRMILPSRIFLPSGTPISANRLPEVDIAIDIDTIITCLESSCGKIHPEPQEAPQKFSSLKTLDS